MRRTTRCLLIQQECRCITDCPLWNTRREIAARIRCEMFHLKLCVGATRVPLCLIGSGRLAGDSSESRSLWGSSTRLLLWHSTFTGSAGFDSVADLLLLAISSCRCPVSCCCYLCVNASAKPVWGNWLLNKWRIWLQLLTVSLVCSAH